MAGSDPFDQRTQTVNVVELMAAELGIHAANGERLLAAGYVTLNGRKLLDRELPIEEGRGRFLLVLGRELRIQPPTRHLPPQGELF